MEEKSLEYNIMYGIMYGPITYVHYIRNQLPKQYTFSDLSEEQKKLVKIIQPDFGNINYEAEKLIKRDMNGIIIINDIVKDVDMSNKIQLLEETIIKQNILLERIIKKLQL
jgi:hypothetical protein